MSKTLLAALALLTNANAGEAEDNVHCGPRDVFTMYLSTHHGEEPVSAGLQGSDKIIEIFTSKEGETWSILVTDNEGTSCLVASGTDWTQGSFLPAGVPG